MQKQFYKDTIQYKKGDNYNLYSNKWIGGDENLIYQIEKNPI